MSNKETIQSLENFIQNIYFGENISNENAIKNLEDGLMEIKYFLDNQHSSNALLITNNGYALTSFHCIENKNDKIIIDSLNNNYIIKKICQYNEKKDIALIKINKNISNNPLIYKIKNINNLLDEYPLGYLIEHKSRWNGEIKNKFGKITKTKQDMILISHKGNHENFEDYIEAEIPIILGDSGGIMIDYTGGLIGFASATNNKTSVYSTIFAGFDLIQKEINLLKSPTKRIIRKLF